MEAFQREHMPAEIQLGDVPGDDGNVMSDDDAMTHNPDSIAEAPMDPTPHNAQDEPQEEQEADAADSLSDDDHAEWLTNDELRQLFKKPVTNPALPRVDEAILCSADVIRMTAQVETNSDGVAVLYGSDTRRGSRGWKQMNYTPLVANGKLPPRRGCRIEKHHPPSGSETWQCGSTCLPLSYVKTIF